MHGRFLDVNLTAEEGVWLSITSLGSQNITDEHGPQSAEHAKAFQRIDDSRKWRAFSTLCKLSIALKMVMARGHSSSDEWKPWSFWKRGFKSQKHCPTHWENSSACIACALINHPSFLVRTKEWKLVWVLEKPHTWKLISYAVTHDLWEVRWTEEVALSTVKIAKNWENGYIPQEGRMHENYANYLTGTVLYLWFFINGKQRSIKMFTTVAKRCWWNEMRLK